MAEMIQVFEGRFLLDQVVQDILGISAPIRFPGSTMNYTDYVISPELPAAPEIIETPQMLLLKVMSKVAALK